MIMATTVPLPPLVVAAPVMRRNPWPILALLALNGVAAAAIWRATTQTIETAPIKSAAQAVPMALPAAADTAKAPAPRSLAELPETARRPLFSATRRPWVEKPKPKPEDPVVKVAAPPLPPAFPISQLQLVGVLQGNANNSARVLIRDAGDAQGTWVQLGESIRGWKIREVSSDSAVIETRGERAELVMDAAAIAPPPLSAPSQPLRRQ